MPKLYFPIGISGSGKSTYIKKHFKPETVVSPDDLRRQFTGDVTDHSQEGKVWAVVPKLLQQKLDKYGEAVLDATNVDSGSRAGLLKKFSRDFVERVAIVFEADPEESKRRIKADLEAGKDRSDVPDEVVDKQQEKFRRGFNTIKQQFDKVIYADRGEEIKQEGAVKDFFKYSVLKGVPYKNIYINKVHNGMAFKHNNQIYIAIRKFDNSNKWVIQNVKTLEVSDAEEDYILKNSLPYKLKGQKNPVDWQKKKELKPNMKTKSEVNEEIEKIRKMIREEMMRLKEEDAEEAQERAQYQSYQDMYLVPQSHWKLKKYANMYDANGNLYRGKLGEVHKLQTVEYDFMHTGEVVTECGDTTYSLDAQEFRECFEMAHDEEGLKVNNESIQKENVSKNDIKVDRINNDKILPGYLKNLLILSLTDMNSYKEKHKKLKTWEKTHLAKAITRLGINVHPDTPIYRDEYGDSYIKEEVKKLVKIKDYFGKNIKASIERLEEAFLTEETYQKKLSKLLTQMNNMLLISGAEFEEEFTTILSLYGLTKKGDELKLNSHDAKNAYNDFLYLKNEFSNNKSNEPEDAYLDQDFEDRISGDP